MIVTVGKCHSQYVDLSLQTCGPRRSRYETLERGRHSPSRCGTRVGSLRRPKWMGDHFLGVIGSWLSCVMFLGLSLLPPAALPCHRRVAEHSSFNCKTCMGRIDSLLVGRMLTVAGSRGQEEAGDKPFSPLSIGRYSLRRTQGAPGGGMLWRGIVHLLFQHCPRAPRIGLLWSESRATETCSWIWGKIPVRSPIYMTSPVSLIIRWAGFTPSKGPPTRGPTELHPLQRCPYDEPRAASDSRGSKLHMYPSRGGPGLELLKLLTLSLVTFVQ